MDKNKIQKNSKVQKFKKYKKIQKYSSKFINWFWENTPLSEMITGIASYIRMLLNG